MYTQPDVSHDTDVTKILMDLLNDLVCGAPLDNVHCEPSDLIVTEMRTTMYLGATRWHVSVDLANGNGFTVYVDQLSMFILSEILRLLQERFSFSVVEARFLPATRAFVVVWRPLILV